MEYYTWKPIGVARAINALQNGARIWKLPVSFCSAGGAAAYTHGLQTQRGACYLLSQRTVEALHKDQQ